MRMTIFSKNKHKDIDKSDIDTSQYEFLLVSSIQISIQAKEGKNTELQK